MRSQQHAPAACGRPKAPLERTLGRKRSGPATVLRMTRSSTSAAVIADADCNDCFNTSETSSCSRSRRCKARMCAERWCSLFAARRVEISALSLSIDLRRDLVFSA